MVLTFKTWCLSPITSKLKSFRTTAKKFYFKNTCTRKLAYPCTCQRWPWVLTTFSSPLEAYILENFETLASGSNKSYAKEFVKSLTKDHLVKFLSSKKLYVSSEGVLFVSVLKWVQYDPQVRAAYLPDLLKHVHLTLMSQADSVLWARFVNVIKDKEKVNRKPNSLYGIEMHLKRPTLHRMAALIQETCCYFALNESSKREYWALQKIKPSRWPKIMGGHTSLQQVLHHGIFRSQKQKVEHFCPGWTRGGLAPPSLRTIPPFSWSEARRTTRNRRRVPGQSIAWPNTIARREFGTPAPACAWPDGGLEPSWSTTSSMW